MLVLVLLGAITMADTTPDPKLNYMFKVCKENLAKARQNPDDTNIWTLTETSLRDLKEAVEKLPPAGRAPFAGSIAQWQPEVAAGACKARATRIAAKLNRELGIAEEDAKQGPGYLNEYRLRSIEGLIQDAAAIPCFDVKAREASAARFARISKK